MTRTTRPDTAPLQASSPNGIEIHHIMPGADILSAGGKNLALGFPEEVVKAWMGAGINIDAWIVPDIRQARGIVQWALEFPLYYALFIQGRFGRGEKIPVVLHRRDWADLLDYLRLSLLGLSVDEMKRVGVSERRRHCLDTESRHLALKMPNGEIAQIEDFIEPIFFSQQGLAQFEGLEIRSHGDNSYSFFSSDDRLEEYRLVAEADPKPPYLKPLSPASSPVLPQPFELTTLGSSNGFDPGGPCSSLMVQSNGRFILVDSGPYIVSLLEHAGVHPNQLDALILTHAHEDHAVGLSALLELDHRLTLYLSPQRGF